MPRGGYREGAGRKSGIPNKLAHELKAEINAEKLISFLQGVAAGELPEATISLRILAASALLKKVVPDCKQIDLEQEASNTIVISYEHAQQVAEAASYEGEE